MTRAATENRPDKKGNGHFLLRYLRDERATFYLFFLYFYLQRNIFSSENHCRHKKKGGGEYTYMLILDAHFQEVVSGRIERAARRTRLLDSR